MTDRGDLEASLAEMDRKLRELQRELSLVAGHGEAPARELPVTGAPAPPPEAGPDPVERVVEEAAARVSELGSRIDDLATLREELDRATQALRAEYRSSRPGTSSPEEVVIDAGPFTDIATLGAFETSLGEVEGVIDAVVRSFEGNRAIVDVGVRPGAELAASLRGGLPFEVDVVEAEGGGLTLHLRSGA